MMFAELVFIIVGIVGIYYLLRPMQRWLEGVLIRRLPAGRPRVPRTTIDVTDLASDSASQKEEDEHYS